MIFIESRLRSLMTYRQARPDPHHVAAHTKEHEVEDFCKTRETHSMRSNNRKVVSDHALHVLSTVNEFQSETVT